MGNQAALARDLGGITYCIFRTYVYSENLGSM